MANKLKPGVLVEIFGLQGAKELNGKQGMLVEYYETGKHAGRWKVRLTERSPVAVKTANLKLIKPTDKASDGKYQKMMAKPMPEMNDLWGITDTSHLDIPMLTEIADRETTLELKEQVGVCVSCLRKTCRFVQGLCPAKSSRRCSARSEQS